MEKFCLLSMLCIVSCCYAHKETGNCYECVKNYVNSIKQNIFSICVSHILRHGIISFVTINKWFFSLPLTECHKAIETSSVTWAYSLSLSSNADFSSGKLWQVSPFLSLSLTDTFYGAIVPHSVPFQILLCVTDVWKRNTYSSLADALYFPPKIYKLFLLAKKNILQNQDAVKSR